MRSRQRGGPWGINLGAIALAAVLGSGCACERRPAAPASDDGPPRRGGTLRLVGSSDVDHLSPISAYVTGSLWLGQLFARQLVMYPPSSDEKAKISLAPDLARELPTQENGGISADGKTYTFHLREGVRWNTSPPRPVTAHDLERSFKLFCNPVSPVGAPRYYTTTIAGMAAYCDAFTKAPGTVDAIRGFVETHPLEGVRALDDSTLAFRLLAPTPDFLNLLAMNFASATPEEYLAYLPDGPEFRQHTLSSGPYAITRYVPGREILLERNPVWDPRSDPGRAAYVDRIRIGLGFDGELIQLQIEAGTADLSFDVSMLTAHQASLLATGDRRVMLSPGGDLYGSMHYLVVNLRSPNAGRALARLDVRQALALAVDRAAAVRVTGGPGVARPLRQAVPSSVGGFRPGNDRYVTPGDRGDPAKARRLLAEAGFRNGLRLRMAHPNEGTFPMEAQVVQAGLRRAGIDAELTSYQSGDFWGRLLPNNDTAERGEWDVAMTAWVPDWFGIGNGRSVVMPLFDGRQLGHLSQNHGRYDVAEVNDAIERALLAPTAEGAEAAWAEAVARITEDVAVVPIVERKSGWMRSARIRRCLWSVLGMQCEGQSVWLADAEPGRSGVGP
jgi:peptide/nickel transport system substrate-binding protein